MKSREKQMVVIVTAYGEDNYFQKRYEDVVGIYTNVEYAIRAAQADGMTNRQLDYLNRTNQLWMLRLSMLQGKCDACQVEYEEETDRRRKSCVSSYMFRTYALN